MSCTRLTCLLSPILVTLVLPVVPLAAQEPSSV